MATKIRVRFDQLNKVNTTVHNVIERTFDNTHEMKILQSGALKIVVPFKADVPAFGDTEVDKEATVENAKTVAVFFGNYFAEVVNED